MQYYITFNGQDAEYTDAFTVHAISIADLCTQMERMYNNIAGLDYDVESTDGCDATNQVAGFFAS